MIQLLILGTTILAKGPFTDVNGSIRAADIVYPKTTIPGFYIVTTDVPADFTPTAYIWNNGALAPNPGTSEQIDAAKLALTGSLEELRVRRQLRGLVYAFPDGTGTIQTRPSDAGPDIMNINGRTTAGMILQGQGINGPVMAFRDQENVTHMMTPTQMVAMGMAVSQFISATYSSKWTKEAEIAALSSLQAVAAYDINAGWPA